MFAEKKGEPGIAAKIDVGLTEKKLAKEDTNFLAELACRCLAGVAPLHRGRSVSGGCEAKICTLS